MLTTLKRYSLKTHIDFSWQTFVIASLSLAVMLMMVNTWLSWQRVGQPFAGFFYRQGIVSANGLPGWPTWNHRLDVGDVVLAVNQQTEAPGNWSVNLPRLTPNQPVEYSLLKSDGQVDTITLSTQQFTLSHFVPLITIPTLFILVIMLFVGITCYLRPDSVANRLFLLYTVALACFVGSQPDFTTGGWFYLNIVLLWLGQILMPPLLLHFLLYFPYRKQVLQTQPFLLPLIYVPVLPLLIHLSTVIQSPRTFHSFEVILNIYNGIYMIAGLASLLRSYQVGSSLIRKQALVLSLGIILPLIIFALYFVQFSWLINLNVEPIYETLQRYTLGVIPAASALAILRYQIFGLNRSTHRQIFYIGTIGLIIAAGILLINLADPYNLGMSRLQPKDLQDVLLAVIIFFVGRLGYHWVRQWWANRHLAYSMADFRVNLRILSRELLRVKSRRDLEATVSWNIPSDFRLRSAELSPSNIPSGPYALRLPLNITDIPLGTLFLGPKINGDRFTARELEIIEEVQHQISLAAFSVELDETIRATEELTRLKSKFLTNVTHELRTPLNSIINFIGFVVDDAEQLNDEQVYHLKQALYSAERLLELINNILDMSKIEAGQMILMPNKLNIAQVISETMPILADYIETKPVEIVTKISPNLPTVYGDSLRVRQIILNILTNAAKFTERGQIYLSVYPNNGHVVVEVADTGRGIDETVLPTIFQGFTTVALTDAGQQVAGPGLGLPITKHLVDLHRGDIDVQSRVGFGTTFRVRLPIDSSKKSETNNIGRTFND